MGTVVNGSGICRIMPIFFFLTLCESVGTGAGDYISRRQDTDVGLMLPSALLPPCVGGRAVAVLRAGRQG